MVCNPRISFLVPDISSPVIGPVTVLARILESHYKVEIVGPDFGHGVCPMYRDTYPYRAISMPRLYRLPEYWWESRRLGRALTGDILIAVKAYSDTIPVVLRERARRGARALAYLDEWDGALHRMRSRRDRWKSTISNLHHPLEDWVYPRVEKRITELDGVLSTTTFLKKKFGGHIVHMGVDTDFFQPPEAAMTANLKASLGLAESQCIVFGGVVRPHKGIELILDALALIGNPLYRLVVVGPKNQHVEDLLRIDRYRPHLVAIGSRPKEEMPQHLSLASAIVLPLSDNALAQSQMPCKVFEAMAMGKPVIASSVSDLPLVLEGCGKIVPPDDARSLSAAIREVFENAPLANSLGIKAREKCIREYSMEATRANLVGIMEQVVSRIPDQAKCR